MLYLLAILCPPLAVLFCGKLGQAIINLILTMAFYIPGMIHAICVVSSHKEDQRITRIVNAIDKSMDQIMKPTIILEQATIAHKEKKP